LQKEQKEAQAHQVKEHFLALTREELESELELLVRVVRYAAVDELENTESRSRVPTVDVFLFNFRPVYDMNTDIAGVASAKRCDKDLEMKDIEYLSPDTALAAVILSTVNKKTFKFVDSTFKFADTATPKKKDEPDEWIRLGKGVKNR